MKIKFWTLYVAMISTRLLAQDTNLSEATAIPTATATATVDQAAPATNAPVSAPNIETPEPAPLVTTVSEVKPEPVKVEAPAPEKKKVVQKKSTPKPAPELKTVPLVPGPAVVSATRVNIRGQAGLKGEILARLTNGEPVTVLEEIKLKRSAPEEPSVWAKIVVPEKMRVWVSAAYVDKTTKAVTARKLNLRGGSGENYSVVGVLKRGEVVKEIETKGAWMQIEAPTNAYAYVAAQYLSQEPPLLAGIGSPGTSAPVIDPPPIVEPTIVVENPTMVATTNVDLPTTTLSDTNVPTTNDVPVVEDPLPPRIVAHEGVVRSSVSIQAPTKYELIHPQTRKLVNYLYTTSPNLDLGRYKGLQIIVTGEEGLDERWRNTPVITIRSIQVIE